MSVVTSAPAAGVSVPCNGCTRCCVNDALRLLPGEDAANYLTEPHAYSPGQLMLAHKPNRECVYLGAHGCTIYERRPLMCRTMDCRNVARAMTFTQARKLKIIGVWRRGKELAAT